MNKEMNIKYEAPEIEVIEVEVEKGFAGSVNEINSPTWEGVNI